MVTKMSNEPPHSIPEPDVFAPQAPGKQHLTEPAEKSPVPVSASRKRKLRFQPGRFKYASLTVVALLFGSVGALMLFASQASTLPNGDVYVQTLGSTQGFIAADGSEITKSQVYPTDAVEARAGTTSPKGPTAVTEDVTMLAYYNTEIKAIKIVNPVNSSLIQEIPIDEAHRNITDKSALRWSPDASKLFVQYTTTDNVLGSFIVNRNTISLVDMPPYAGAIGWTADGLGVVYFKDGKLCTNTATNSAETCNTITVAGIDPLKLTSSGAGVSPDGTKVALISRDVTRPGIMVVGVDGVLQSEIKVPITINAGAPVLDWSPDGTMIAFSATDLSGTGGICDKLCTVNVSTKEAKASTVFASVPYDQIANINWTQRTHKSTISLPPAGLPTAHQNGNLFFEKGNLYDALDVGLYPGGATEKENHALFSPQSGKQVYYIAERKRANNSVNVNDSYLSPAVLATKFVNRTNQKDLVTLPNPEANWAMDDISPDGQWILLRKTSVPGVSWGSVTPYEEVWIVRPDGTSLQRVTTRSTTETSYGYVYGYKSAWGSDSRTIYYLKGGMGSGGSITPVSLCAQNIVQPYDVSCRELAQVKARPSYISVSPDGKKVLFGAYNETTNDHSLYTVGVNDSSLVKVATADYSLSQLTWSPDGKRVVYSSNRGLSTVEPSGANPQDISPYRDALWQPLPLRVARASHDYTSDGLADVRGVSSFMSSEGIIAPGDYTLSGKSQTTIWKPQTGTWHFDSARGVFGSNSRAYGIQGDIPVPADYNGDGKADTAVWRPLNATWHVYGGTVASQACGAVGDIPVPADYNGDGKADFAVYRPSTATFYLCGGVSTAYGTKGDIPVPADYNGDGKADFAVYRPSTSTFYSKSSASAVVGAVGDIPVPADYNGDGKADFASVTKTTNAYGYYNLKIAGSSDAIVVEQPAVLPFVQGKLAGSYIPAQTPSSATYAFNIPAQVYVRTTANTALVNYPTIYGGMTPDGTNSVVMRSANGKYSLKFSRGGLYLYNNATRATAYLNRQTASSTAATSLTLKTDGNLVFYRKTLNTNPWSTAWQTGTAGKGATKLSLRDDGNLVVTNAANGVVWQSGTANRY